MKKIIILTITTLLLLLNCSNGANEPKEPPIPCKDENCLTDEQLNFFKMHLEDDTLTKKVLFEMSSMDLSSKSITSLDTGIFNNLINLTSVDLTDNPICSVDKSDVGLTDRVNLTFEIGQCLTEAQLTFFSDKTSITTKKELYEAPTLGLNSNSITNLEAGIFNNLTNLTTLSLYDNQLASIPAEIGNLTSLTELLLDNNQLESIPTGIGNLTSLTALRLYNNQLTKIPDGIFTKLTNLTTLWLKNGSSDQNMFDCTRDNYDTWGLPDPRPGTLSLVCND